jgi:mRNA-degrading endonuclease HigB of HigAB toxin-antitoxin module
MTLSLNNLSRNIFKQLMEKNPKMKRIDSRNVFDYKDRRYAFSITENSKLVVRQLYSDCTDILCYNNLTGVMYHTLRGDMVVQAKPNRITVSGLKAHSATGSTQNAKIVKFKV